MLVSMLTPDPEAPLWAWVARPLPVLGIVLAQHCAPQGPHAAHQLDPSMHPPPAQRAGTDAKLP